MCIENGIDTTVMHNSMAMTELVIRACTEAVKGMTSGDLLVLYISGHGGQVPDIHGDEIDGQDETLCLWDRQLEDDDIGELLENVPAGVRVFFVTDTCNSGTNYRGAPINAMIQRGVDEIPELKCQVIHYGGCDDGKSSYGGAEGGIFTNAFVEQYNKHADVETYSSLFVGVQKEVSSQADQIPTYAEYGNVTDEFRNAPIFS
jgi:hypothetical protein